VSRRPETDPEQENAAGLRRHGSSGRNQTQPPYGDGVKYFAEWLRRVIMKNL
jgi:hypothetical protein